MSQESGETERMCLTTADNIAGFYSVKLVEREIPMALDGGWGKR